MKRNEIKVTNYILAKKISTWGGVCLTAIGIFCNFYDKSHNVGNYVAILGLLITILGIYAVDGIDKHKTHKQKEWEEYFSTKLESVERVAKKPPRWS